MHHHNVVLLTAHHWEVTIAVFIILLSDSEHADEDNAMFTSCCQWQYASNHMPYTDPNPA